jgi:hypothetical protein
VENVTVPEITAADHVLGPGVNATPKFYVDGRRIDGKFPLEGLEDAIRASIRAASAGGQPQE